MPESDFIRALALAAGIRRLVADATFSPHGRPSWIRWLDLDRSQRADMEDARSIDADVALMAKLREYHVRERRILETECGTNPNTEE